MTLVLTSSEIEQLLDMAEVIEVVEQAHRLLATGRAVQPSRTSVALPGSTSVLIPMIAALGPQADAGMKLLTDTPSNARERLPVQQSLIVLIDPNTGGYEAILHGAAITRFRTAAASAVATRHLARSASRSVGFIGAGTLARTHLAALRLVRPLSDVVVWSRTLETAKSFADEAGSDGLVVRVAASAEEVVRSADVVCTLTPSKAPHVMGRWFRAGQHINAVGAPPRPDHREIDTEGIVRSRVVVDSRQVAYEESGEVLIPLAEGAIDKRHFAVELGDVIAGNAVGRRSDDDITLYNSIGLGIQDVAAAGLVVSKARKKGLGLELRLAR